MPRVKVTRPKRQALLLRQLRRSPACAIGPRYTPPTPAMPNDWHETAVAGGFDRSTLEHWWTEFHDPLLDDLIARAIDGNLDLKIAAARVREARAARGIAASAALPQVGVHGQSARTERSDAVPPIKGASGEGSPFGPRTQNAFEVGFDAGWELDVFGGVRSDVEAAVAQVQSAEENRRDVLVTLLADVARNFSELRGTQRQIEILDATVQSQQDTLDVAKARVEAGLGTALDVERASGLLESRRAGVGTRASVGRGDVSSGRSGRSRAEEQRVTRNVSPSRSSHHRYPTPCRPSCCRGV